MKILLLTGNFNHQTDSQIIPALKTYNNCIWIDHQIEQVLKLNYDVDVVLGYQNSEEILRQSKLLKKCNIIFDPNENEGHPYSNLHAGLFAACGPSIMLPINFATPILSDWQLIIKKLYQIENTENHIVRPYCPVKGEMKPGYPVGFTRKGVKLFLYDQDVKDFNDPPVKAYKLPILDKRILSPDYTQNI